ncbi:hypothetical protein [Pseudomarimonas salicorniae]|uniref:Chalcone isomerase-like n=1 Tax=Pseudomarimonas salicorniae TaxID=2933270 RepID=A0ABT0GIV6_9GAMM|nr:hypothetical protein [Lysobacter sp. CAU 1642]MCK7594491.1 hypothetical protein [Lysobacter sp. CAU 1642]
MRSNAHLTRALPACGPWLRAGLTVLLLAGALLAARPALACEAPIYAQYRSQSPLLAELADSALLVAVHADGCVLARFPKHDLRAGTRQMGLSKADWRSLRAEIDAAAVQSIDTRQLKQRLAAADAAQSKALDAGQSARFHASADENLIEFVLPPSGADKRPRALSWTGLHADQLRLPGDPELVRIAALRGLFEDLASQAHAKGEVQP